MLQYSKAIYFRVIAIDTRSEKQEMFLNKLDGEELLDLMKSDVVANANFVTGGLGARAVILLAASEKSSQQFIEVNLP